MLILLNLRKKAKNKHHFQKKLLEILFLIKS